MSSRPCAPDSVCTNVEHHEAHMLWLRGHQWRIWIPRVWWRPSTWFSKKFGRWSTDDEVAQIERAVLAHIEQHRSSLLQGAPMPETITPRAAEGIHGEG